MLNPFLDLKIQLEVILTHKGRSRSCHRGQILEKGPGSSFSHKSLSDVLKESFWEFLGMLIPFLDLKIQLEVIMAHKGHSRSRRRCQILRK